MGDTDVVTAAHHVLSVAGDRGHWMRPGSFFSALIEAALRADADNLMRISIGFPITGAMVNLYKSSGPAALRAIANDGRTER